MYAIYDAVKLLDVSIVIYHEPNYPVQGCCNVAVLIFSLLRKLKCKSK